MSSGGGPGLTYSPYVNFSIKDNTFGGGVNEMQRDLICLFGLSMPVMPRF